jgi:excisionase family DNA binding protein
MISMEDKDKMLTVKEVATCMRVEPRTVLRWMHLGRLRARRIGKTVRVRHSDLVRAMDVYEYGAPPPRDPSMG